MQTPCIYSYTHAGISFTIRICVWHIFIVTPHHNPHSGAWGTIGPTFDVHILPTWNLHRSFVLQYYALLHRVRAREMTSFQSTFTPMVVLRGGHPRTRYYMTNFCCVMSPELQFGLKLGISVSYLAAKEQIRHMNGSSLTYTPPWYTTVVSNTRHTLGPTFVAHNPLSWSWNTSFPWMCSTTLQKSRYGTWSVRPLFIPP